VPLWARRREYDEDALREAAAALSLNDGLGSAEIEVARAKDNSISLASRTKVVVEVPVVAEGEEVGLVKWHKGEEFVLRESQPGQLGYVRILKPGVSPLMAFGQRRGTKRKRFAYKGHVSPYVRLSPKSPLWKLVVAEKDLIEEGRVRLAHNRVIDLDLIHH
jgi:hypothetical protein